MVTLITAKADHSAFTVSCENRDMMTHHHQIAGLRVAYMLSQSQRIDGATGRIGQVVTGATDHDINEITAPRSRIVSKLTRT